MVEIHQFRSILGVNHGEWLWDSHGPSSFDEINHLSFFKFLFSEIISSQKAHTHPFFGNLSFFMGPLKMGHLTFAHPTFLCHTESQIYGVGYMTYSLHIIIPYLHHFSIICLPHTCSSNSHPVYSSLPPCVTSHFISSSISYPQFETCLPIFS